MSTSQVFAPTAGTDGRVKTHDTDVVIAGVTMWKRNGKAAMIEIAHFESEFDTETETVQANVLKGLGSNTVSLEGIVNLNATAQTEVGNTGITNGAYVHLDLYMSQTLATGYDNVPGWISEFTVTQTIDNQACKWSATLTVDGPFPAYGTIT